MQVSVVFKTARSISIKLEDGGKYNTIQSYDIYLNNQYIVTTNKVITSLYNLNPACDYLLSVKANDMQLADLSFKTDYEFVTLNVKQFGAKGDGINDDTIFIQACMMACPKDSRVYLPKGRYVVSSLFLKSNINIEIAKDAILLAKRERADFPILPGLIKSYDETSEYNLGSWEGDPLDMFSSVICGINCENVVIYGEGVIDGLASFENWWNNPKTLNVAFRPRLFFINNCENVIVQGLHFTNSPAWTVHPYFSNNLKFIDLLITNPPNSPNTDGLNPESCSNVEILGVKFSLGDDCIAIKSGKIYMGSTYKKPSVHILIEHCLMKEGHGAITIGSEMAGGVQDVTVRNCLFEHTDRGLRIKTRRGRGKQAVLDKIIFENIKMNHVKTPLVINAFYFCDADGKSDYVQSKAWHEVDERTPVIKKLGFYNIEAENAHVAAAYFYGLPEQKIEEIEMINVKIGFCEKAVADVPAMMCEIEPCTYMGLFANNVKKLTLEKVEIIGYTHQEFILENIDNLIRR